MEQGADDEPAARGDRAEVIKTHARLTKYFDSSTSLAVHRLELPGAA